MQAVKSKNTAPELIVRRAVHEMGYRFRLHCEDLPGKPDLVFPSLRKALFVNGCFWHGHSCARGARVPRTNTEYWTAKIARNMARDANSRQQLEDIKWTVLTIWECEAHDRVGLNDKLRRFLSRPSAS
jgi:DNA mismatch endonuclease (patch repair protein)